MLKNSKYVYGDQNVKVPVNLHCGDYILNKLIEFKDNIALISVETEEKLTYGQIAQQAINFAVSLRRVGLQTGDVVGLSSENKLEFFGAVVGILYAGGIVTPISIAYTKDEAKHILGISKPKYVICSPSAYKYHQKSFKSSSIKKIIIFGNVHNFDAIAYDDMVKPGGRFLKKNVCFDEIQAAEVQGQIDGAFIMYSSGTTGLPKGCIITHLNVLGTLCSGTQIVTTESPIYIAVFPWIHAMGLFSNLMTLMQGKTIVYFNQFDLKKYVDIIEKYKPSFLHMVPALTAALVPFAGKRDFSSVHQIRSGGAPLYSENYEDIKKIFPNVKVVTQGYGMTEATIRVAVGFTSMLMADGKRGSCGTPAPGIIYKIVDVETRKVLGERQNGEILIKGASVTPGYIGRCRKEYFDEEGFFKTGDIGYYDEDKCLFIVDRLKELIKYKAYQVPPAEIEAKLLEHDAVMDAAVVGIPDKKAGEVPLAFIVKRPGKEVTAKEIQDFISERLSSAKHLRGGVRFINQIPRNPTGKILRRKLKESAVKSPSKL